MTFTVPPARLAATVILPFVLLFCFDGALFRTRLYQDWIEPESTAGTTLYGLHYAAHTYAPAKDNVLLIGDSRVGEGISARIVNDVLGATRLNLALLPIAGSTPRVWYYVLRAVDPQPGRYRAIVLMADTLREDEVADAELIDRVLDLNYLAPLVRPWDLVPLRASFNAKDGQARAVRTCLFAGQALRKDILDFLASPAPRLSKVRAWAEHRNRNVDDYPGRPERLPAVSWRPGEAAPLGLFPAAQRTFWTAYFQKLEHPVAEDGTEGGSAGYRRQWFSRILERYAGTGTRILVLLMPRGPYHMLSAAPVEPQGDLAEWAKSGRVRVLPYRQALGFERPEYFADWLHLNRAGREGYSRVVGSLLRDWLQSNPAHS